MKRERQRLQRLTATTPLPEVDEQAHPRAPDFQGAPGWSLAEPGAGWTL